MYENEDYTRAYMPYQPSNLRANPMMDNYYPSGNLPGMNTYPDMNKYMQQMNTMPGMQNMQMMNTMQNTQMMNEDLERMYPESYRLIYPMVKKACDMMDDRVITEVTLNEMTDRIYLSMEAEDSNADMKMENRKEDPKETRVMPMRPRNKHLNDLIRILLLREIFDRRHRRPHHMLRSSYQPYMPKPYYNY